MDIIRAYVQGGGAVLFSCDYTDPIENMPNVLSLLRSYGFLPESGLVMASPDETDTFYNNSRASGAAAGNAGDGCDTGDDAERADGDAHGCQPRLRPFAGIGQFPASGRGADNIRQELSGPDTTASRLSITQSDSDKTGPFALALQAKRFTDTGDVSRARVHHRQFRPADRGTALHHDRRRGISGTRCVFLTGDDSIDTSIMVKTALRPGLSVNALSLGSVVLVGLQVLN